MEKERIQYLHNQYLNDSLSFEESGEWLRLINDPENESIVKSLMGGNWELVKQDLLDMESWRADQILNHIIAQPQIETRQFNLWNRISAAAAILLIIGATLFFYNRYNLSKSTTINIFANDVHAGVNKAFLTLADGRKLSLSDAVNGQIAVQNGVVISKTGDGRIIYGSGSSLKGAMNQISTPNGGTWQICLPDGTMVWLNAGSSLSYPVSFKGQKERHVELRGQAYFEVVKDKTHPFSVLTKGQLIEVLGTHFDVSSYAEDSVTSTTLLEGSVKITPLDLMGAKQGKATDVNSLIIKPGEQGVNTAGLLTVKQVNVERIIAWKNGYFMFDNEELETIMTKIARWYDVKVVYEDNSVKTEKVFAAINRFENISKVLNMLAKAGVVKFKVKNNTVYIQRNKKD